MTTNREVYEAAKKHLGHHGSHARAYCGLGSGQPYCCAFVTMCFHDAKADKLFYGGKKVTYCPAAIQWCRANLAQVPPYLAMRMDLIFFDWQPNGTPDHIGFVKEKISDSKIRTLEGNTSGGIVTEKTRSGYIQGIFRPHFAPDKKLAKGKLTVDGDFGYHSIYMLQTALGIKADGVLGKATVKALQKKAGASPDGAWGPKTSKKVQKMIGTKADGAFGRKSVIALQKWVNAKVYPPAKPKTAVTKKAEAKPVQLTEREKKINAMCDWATKIAKSGKYKYKKWKNGKANTHKCPICHPESGNGWNCIGFAFAVWHHGGGLRTNCNCGVVTNGQSEKLLTLPMADALKLARRLIGTDKIKIIRNGGKAIPLSMLQKGDILLMFKGRKYYHTAFYMGSGRYADSSKTHKPNIKAGMSLSAKRKSHTKVAIRYTG